MNVNGPTTTTANLAVRNVNAAQKAYGVASPQTASPQTADRAELSKTGELQRLVELAKTGDVRAEKVAALKAQINACTYDIEGKADIVADRILDDLGM
jgi:anti-sigma28 factor (negative regulator of flagellin synthesis)